jgi:hypothetical protein
MDKTKGTQDHVLTDVASESGVGTDGMMIVAQDDSVAGFENISSEMTSSEPKYSQPDSNEVSGSRSLDYPAIKNSGTDASPIFHAVSGPTPEEPPTVVPHTIQASPGIASRGSASGVPRAKAQTTQNDSVPRESPGSGKMSAEELTKLIESYCDPTRWASDESRKDWKMYETEEDGFDDNAFDDEDPDDMGDGNHRKFLYHRETVALLKLLSDTASAQPHSGNLLEKVRQWMPKGLLLSSRQLLASIHLDRFQNPEMKKQAHAAFTGMTEPILSKLSPN